MTDERKLEMFDSLVEWVYCYAESNGKDNIVRAFREVGFTEKEANELMEGFE